MGFVPRRVEIMIAAGNIRGAIRYLGGSETDNIVDLVKNRFTEELEEAIHKISRYTTRGDQERIREWGEKKDRIENKIRELENRYKESLAGNCNICWSQLDKPALVPCCNNLFCGACLMTWLSRKTTCPLCREPLTISDLTYITEESEEKVEEDPKITKPQQIVKILQDNKEGKFIIFSDEDATYNCLSNELNKEDLVCKEIKGRSESREKLIREFKSGKTRVIFLNSRNNGAGINLQECTDIILYHRMEDSTTTQILGRANRIGRLEELNVHHLQVC
jgi:superfamily II DNA or RNA helicase